MVSIIIPAFNIIPDVKLVHESLKGLDYEILVEYDHFGAGKGVMLQRGFKKSKGQRIVWLDADMQIHPKFIKRYIFLDKDVIIGSKFLPESKVSYSLKRRVLSYLGHLVTKVLFRLPFNDTQCGFKIFRRDLLDRPWKMKGFGYDIEVLTVIAKENGLTLQDVPVEVTDRNETSVSLKACFKTLYELLWLKWALTRPDTFLARKINGGAVCKRERQI